MLIKKYNTKTKKYGVPFECECLSYCTDMSKIVECPSCHKKVKFGDTYNTGEYYDLSGLWRIGICEDCAKEIWEKGKR